MRRGNRELSMGSSSDKASASASSVAKRAFLRRAKLLHSIPYQTSHLLLLCSVSSGTSSAEKPSRRNRAAEPEPSRLRPKTWTWPTGLTFLIFLLPVLPAAMTLLSRKLAQCSRKDLSYPQRSGRTPTTSGSSPTPRRRTSFSIRIRYFLSTFCRRRLPLTSSSRPANRVHTHRY